MASRKKETLCHTSLRRAAPPLHRINDRTVVIKGVNVPYKKIRMYGENLGSLFLKFLVLKQETVMTRNVKQAQYKKTFTKISSL